MRFDVPTCGDVPTFFLKTDVPTFWYQAGDVPTFARRPHLLGLGATVGTIDFIFSDVALDLFLLSPHRSAWNLARTMC